MSYSDIFPVKLSADIPADQLENTQARINGGNIVIATSDLFEDDLKSLKLKLDDRNIRLGDVIGVGSAGGITYNLLDKQGGVIKSAVLRIDPVNMVTNLEPPNPARIRLVLREGNDSFAASIVPRAQRAVFTNDEFMKSLAVINADHQLAHVRDLEKGQFMKIPGISVPVLTDLSSISADANALKGFGTQVDGFLNILKKDRKTLDAMKIPPEEMAQLRSAQESIHNAAVQELTAAGINLEAVPTKQDGVTLTPVEQTPNIGLAK